MSGKCYPPKNMPLEIASSRSDNKNMEISSSRQNPNAHENINQLLDYETMVSSAESKCSQLKGQLDRIKQFYNNQTGIAKSPRIIQHPDAKLLKGRTGSYIESSGNKNIIKKIRQNSQAIGTDKTGAALGTINNILAGITKPMQMPDFFPDSKKPCDIKTNQLCQNPLYGIEDVKINSKSKQSLSIKTKSRRSGSRIGSITSSTTLKKHKKAGIKSISDKRYIKNSENQPPKTTVINKRSRKIMIKPRTTFRDASKDVYTSSNKFTSGNSDLVEIYHNNAVKESKSSDSDMIKKKYSKVEEKIKTNIELVPPLTIEEDHDKFKEVKGVVSCIYKNYTLPTISSTMKKVAKYYMNSFNIKTIPFCLSTSTGPSHNIGINIQQVMSMVKSKQAYGKLSPTLAYNIGLAAGKKEDNSIPYLISRVTSRNRLTQCPLSKHSVNYQHLQEIAKTIPQETIEEMEENEEANSPETQSMIITGPSGDVKVTNRKQPVWTANFEDKKCTCVTPKGAGFQQIVNKFNGAVSKPKSINSGVPVISLKLKEQRGQREGNGDDIGKSANDFLPLQNKERKLKEVLGKLHDEFEKMTKTYDDLVKKHEESSDNTTITKELEILDKELNTKEEEIVMVMSLYKEVLALKQQVKSLKERTSKENISIRNQPPKFSGYNNVTTEGLLNKLLERVQHFQTHYKRH